MRILKAVLMVFAIVSLLPIYLLLLAFAFVLSLLIATAPPTPGPQDNERGDLLATILALPGRFIGDTFKELFSDREDEDKKG